MEGDEEILLDSTLLSTLKFLSADGPESRNELFCKNSDIRIASQLK